MFANLQLFSELLYEKDVKSTKSTVGKFIFRYLHSLFTFSEHSYYNLNVSLSMAVRPQRA